MRLKSKVAVVTGAAGAIGAATAQRFAAEGARLVLLDLDENQLKEVAARHDLSDALLIPADLTSPEANQAMALQVVAKFGPIDVFFANAGVEGTSAPMVEYPTEAYQRVMDVNVKGVLLGLQAVVPQMRDGGSIILASSIAGVASVPRNIAYSVSKHAVVGLMRCAAFECAPRRIRVNCVNPGFVDSPMLRRLLEKHPDPAASEAAFLSGLKLGRFVLPLDVANAVLFLASDESSMIDSQTLLVDGGMLG